MAKFAEIEVQENRWGNARVLSRKVLNESLQKLEEAEAAKAIREKAALERKSAAEAKKHAKTRP